MNYEGNSTLNAETKTSSTGHDDTGVGSLLKASRLRINEDLANVATSLRIRYPYLEAIEENRFASLPGQTYAIGFVRAYAEYLGLDSDEVVRRYKAESSGMRQKSNLTFPEPVSETGIPGGAVAFVGIIVAVLAYGGWYVSTSDKNVYDTLVSPLPDRLVEMLPGSQLENPEILETENAESSGPVPELTVNTEGPAQPDPETLPEPAQENTSSEPVSPEPGASENSSEEINAETANVSPEQTTEPVINEEAAAEVVEEVTEAVQAIAPTVEAIPEEAASEVATSPEPEVTPAPEPVVDAPAVPTVVEAVPVESATEEPVAEVVAAPPSPPAAPETATESDDSASRIVIHAKANSWIQIIDTKTNEMMMTRLLRVGDEYVVPNQNGLKLLTGNAGALEVRVDGAVVPAIGGDGDVRRGIALDVGRLKAGIAILE